MPTYNSKIIFTTGIASIVGFLGFVACIWGAFIPDGFGFALFLWVPIFVGLVSSLLLGLGEPQSYRACLQCAFYSGAIASASILIFGLQGILCIVMAAPIVIPGLAIGATMAYHLQRIFDPRDPRILRTVLFLCALTPALLGFESRFDRTPPLRSVTTSVVVNAPPERVWGTVIEFPPIPEPTDWMLRTGIAYPTHATLEEHEGKLIRYCHFDTGPFVEPITAIEPPFRLAFDVASQPPPMAHLAFADKPGPQLEPYFRSRNGEFALEALPDGRTRLTGTTWYTLGLWPQKYWLLWSDEIVHRVHRRVLEHIGNTVDAADGPAGKASRL